MVQIHLFQQLPALGMSAAGRDFFSLQKHSHTPFFRLLFLVYPLALRMSTKHTGKNFRIGYKKQEGFIWKMRCNCPTS